MNVLIFSENIYDYMSELLYLIAGIYLFNLFNFIFLRSSLNIFGIHPRQLVGIPGIFLSPFLHGSTEHFLMNAIPFFFISLMMVVILDWDLMLLCLETIIIFSGILTWIAGRRGVHIGASGLVTGMFGWVLYWTMYNPSVVNIVILSILLIYFSSIFFGIIPVDAKISWEGHLMGLISGVVCAQYPQVIEFYCQTQIAITSIYIEICSSVQAIL